DRATDSDQWDGRHEMMVLKVRRLLSTRRRLAVELWPGTAATTDSQSVELNFVDLLYAVPVADLAIRASQTNLQGVPLSGWADTSLALWTILLGWIGHHTN